MSRLKQIGDQCYIVDENPISITTSCLICGEPVEFNEFEKHSFVVKVCDKCKKAIMKVRKDLENDK